MSKGDHAMTRTFLCTALASTTILVGTLATAHADPDATVTSAAQPAAVPHGLELGLALGAASSTGTIGDGMRAGHLIGAAGQLDLEIGYRATPNITLAFYGNGQALARGPGEGRSVYTGAAGLQADYHVRPGAQLDPWISVGTGVRAYLIDDDDVTLGVGWELARVQLGLDVRTTPHFAFGPVIGASASLYGAEMRPMEDFHELADKGITWTFTGGIAGRFNLSSDAR
jgi:hypothetical protein